jgi:predicted component of type VI protein secretion system
LNALRRKKGLAPLPVHAYDTRRKDFDQLADWLQDNIDADVLNSIVKLPLQRRA